MFKSPADKITEEKKNQKKMVNSAIKSNGPTAAASQVVS